VKKDRKLQGEDFFDSHCMQDRVVIFGSRMWFSGTATLTA